MGKKTRISALLLVAVLVLGGCGTPVYELTDEEQDLIIQYSAYMVAKHNIFQKDGLKVVAAPEKQPETGSETEEPETENGAGPENSPQDSPGQSPKPDDGSPAGEMTLAEAIGHKDDLQVSYDGYKVAGSYKVENYFYVDAEPGNKLVVMYFTIKNPGAQTVEIDMLFDERVFYGCFDGSSQILEHESFGLNSLSSYEGKIRAGKSQKTMLLFQIPEEQAKQIQAESLFVKLNGTTYSVKL